MTPDQKIQFITNLMDSVRDELCRKVNDGRIPAEWDGHELRELMAEKFAAEATCAEMKDRRSVRYKAYRNAVVTFNLDRM